EVAALRTECEDVECASVERDEAVDECDVEIAAGEICRAVAGQLIVLQRGGRAADIDVEIAAALVVGADYVDDIDGRHSEARRDRASAVRQTAGNRSAAREETGAERQRSSRSRNRSAVQE